MALSHKNLHTLLRETSDIFKKEDALVRVNSDNAMIVGDIHGNLKALEFLLKMRGELKCNDIVFLGDYVDRGKDSVAVLCKLLELKTEEPQNVTLLRGNHETREMNIRYGFYDEVENDELFITANKTFKEMPVAALVNDTIFCVHGGIPGPVDIEEISKEGAFPYLWNDPSSSMGLTPSFRGLRPQCFGPDVFDEFMERNRLSLMIRAHTALLKGYAWWFDRRLLSLFSTPEYTGKDNVAAFSILKGNKISILVFGKTGQNKYGIIMD